MSNRKHLGISTSELAGLVVVGLGVGWLVGLSVSPVVSIVVSSVTGIAAAIVATMIGLEDERTRARNGSEDCETPNCRWRVNPWPLSILIIGLVLGSIGGVWARTHNWLGESPYDAVQDAVNVWSNMDTGLSDDQIERRLFELEYPYTPYADSLKWLKPDSSASMTSTLTLETQLWAELGLPQEEVARRFFELTYPPRHAVSTADFEAVSSQTSYRNGVLFALTNLEQGFFGECRRLVTLDALDLAKYAKGTTNDGIRQLAISIEDSDSLKGVLEAICGPE